MCATEGHLELLMWGCEQSCFLDYKVTFSAALSGNLEMVKWAVQEQEIDWTRFSTIRAAQKGHLHILKWLEDFGFELSRYELAQHAVYHEHANILEWCAEVNPYTSHVIQNAAYGGKLDLLKKIQELNPSLFADSWDMLLFNATKKGHLDIVQWVSDKMPLNSAVIGWATRSGQLNVLKWAREKGFPWEPRSCWKAVASGNLELLQWSLLNGCSWKEESSLINAAASSGNLEMVKWIRAQGIDWTDTTLVNAVASGNAELFDWLLENGCPASKMILLCTTAIHSENMRALEWAENQMSEPLEADVFQGCLISMKLLQWSRRNLRWDSVQVTKWAIEGERFEALKWVVDELKEPWEPIECARKAAQKESIQILRFLKEKGCSWAEHEVGLMLLSRDPRIRQFAQNELSFRINTNKTTCSYQEVQHSQEFTFSNMNFKLIWQDII